MLNVCHAGIASMLIAVIIILLATDYIPVVPILMTSLFFIGSFFVRSHTNITKYAISHGFSFLLLLGLSLQRKYTFSVEIQQFVGQYLGFYLGSLFTFIVFGKSKNHLLHSLVPLIALVLSIPVDYLFGASAQQLLSVDAAQQVIQIYGYAILLLSSFTYVLNKRSWIDIGLVRTRQTLTELEEKQHQLNAIKTKNERNIILMQEREKIKIHREVHDGIGQMAVSLRMLWDRYTKIYGKNDDSVEIDEQMKALILESRLIMQNLSSLFNEKTTLKTALGNLTQIAQKSFNIPINFFWTGPDMDYGDISLVHFFRIAQETLSNALKYANAQSINLEVDNDPNLSVLHFTLTDDGVGFDPATTPRGFGLDGVQERADIIHAEFEVKSQIGTGTIIGLKLKFDNHN